MRQERCGDEILGVEDHLVIVHDVARSHRIQMVNRHSVWNNKVWMTEVATVVSSYDMPTKVSPFLGTVECLINIAIGPEGCVSNIATESEVVESLSKSL